MSFIAIITYSLIAIVLLLGFGIVYIRVSRRKRRLQREKNKLARVVTITFPNKVGNVEAVAKRLAKSIVNQGVRLKIDQLGLLWELLHACGIEPEDFKQNKRPMCEECGRPLDPRPISSHKMDCSWRK